MSHPNDIRNRALASAKTNAVCQTPGAVYNTQILNPPQVINLSVTLPNTVARLTPKQAMQVQEDMHKAVEKVLSKFFVAERKAAKALLLNLKKGIT